MKEVKLFGKYKCSGFLKKAHDGIFISLDKRNLRADVVCTKQWDNGSGGVIASGVETAEKTYYEHVSRNFVGVVVGFIDVVETGFLDVNYEDVWDTGVGTMPERFYVSKRPGSITRCAIVYYANNRKHIVPLRDFIEEEL